MKEIAKRHQDQLKRIKKNVEISHEYFEHNYRAFNEFRKFVYVTTLSDSDVALLERLKKPQLEFNTLEAYISRMVGEFSKQRPSFYVSASQNTANQQVDPRIIPLAEGYLRYKEYEARKNGTQDATYKDQLTGGFSVIKIWTEYKNQMSMQQDIKFGRVYDPTLCGFDPLAELPHKGDGKYCYQFYPMRREDFELEYPDVDVNDLKFTKSGHGLNWSYETNGVDALIVCEYSEKHRKKVKIAQLTNGEVIKSKDYEDFIEKFQQDGRIDQPPQIMSERTTTIENIHRYVFIENQVIEFVDTDFRYLPLVFFDGNSVQYRDTENAEMKQKTRPYVYHAKGIQKLKNFAGQSLANELENMVQHKFKVALASIPEQYLDAYKNYQIPNVMIYNHVDPDNPAIPIPPPMEIVRPPIPAEIINTFRLADETTQTILGSYDAALGINNNQLSGVAIVEGATQSNATAMPYIVANIQGMTQVGTIILDLMPKYLVTPATIPIIDKEGKQQFATINQPGTPSFEFGEDALNVEIEASVNFSIQKTRTLNQIISMMSASEMFSAFINSMGLKILIDNMDIRGAQELKELAAQFMAEQEQAKNNPPPPNPLVISAQAKMAEVQMKEKQNQIQNRLDAAKISIQQEQVNNDKLELASKIHSENIKTAVQVQKVDAERAGQAVELAVKAADMSHRHAKDVHEAASKILTDSEDNEEM